jgi:hypothetical protein
MTLTLMHPKARLGTLTQDGSADTILSALTPWTNGFFIHELVCVTL